MCTYIIRWWWWWYYIIQSLGLQLACRFFIFGRLFADHGQIAERPALGCGMCLQVKRPAIRLIIRFGGGIVGWRAALGRFALNVLARYTARQQVRQTAEFRCRRIQVERRSELAVLDARHQVVHEVIPESHFGQRLVTRQQFVHPTVGAVLVWNDRENSIITYNETYKCINSRGLSVKRF